MNEQFGNYENLLGDIDITIYDFGAELSTLLAKASTLTGAYKNELCTIQKIFFF